MLRIALVLLAVSGVAAALHLLSGCAKPGESFHSQDITGADYGQLVKLTGFTDHTGRRLASADFTGPPRSQPRLAAPHGGGVGLGRPSADFSGKAIVVFFGYTQCPDICPTTLTTMKEVMRLLGTDADRVQVLFVSVDPERDTPELLAAYVPWFDPRFLGLRADPDTTRAAAQAFKVFYARANAGMGESALGYSIDHTANSYAYDPQGRLRLLINHGAKPEHISEDLSKLLAGK
ncbi:MAG: SCO family protein [Rhodocyclaceae bacterium]|nr:SCO family protein [Rhodocyclaceae bacterium]